MPLCYTALYLLSEPGIWPLCTIPRGHPLLKVAFALPHTTSGMFGGYQFNNHAPVTWNSSGISSDLKGLDPYIPHGLGQHNGCMHSVVFALPHTPRTAPASCCQCMSIYAGVEVKEGLALWRPVFFVEQRAEKDCEPCPHTG